MRMLNTLRPTHHQQRVLAIIAGAKTPTTAAQQLSGSRNLVTARDMLMKLGAVTVTSNGAELTNAGQKVAQDSNIVDQSGQLTDVGQQLISSDQPTGADTAPMDELPGGDNMDFDIGGGEFANDDPNIMGNDPNVESFTLLRQLLK